MSPGPYESTSIERKLSMGWRTVSMSGCSQAEMRQAELMERRRRRREELDRQASLTLQGVERMTSVLVLPHPEREKPEVRNLKPDPETEQIAMRVAIEYERLQGRVVADVHE